MTHNDVRIINNIYKVRVNTITDIHVAMTSNTLNRAKKSEQYLLRLE